MMSGSKLQFQFTVQLCRVLKNKQIMFFLPNQTSFTSCMNAHPSCIMRARLHGEERGRKHRKPNRQPSESETTNIASAPHPEITKITNITDTNIIHLLYIRGESHLHVRNSNHEHNQFFLHLISLVSTLSSWTVVHQQSNESMQKFITRSNEKIVHT